MFGVWIVVQNIYFGNNTNSEDQLKNLSWEQWTSMILWIVFEDTVSCTFCLQIPNMGERIINKFSLGPNSE